MKRTFSGGVLLAVVLLMSVPGLGAQELNSEFDGGSSNKSSTGGLIAQGSAPAPLVWSGDHFGIYHQPLWGDNWNFNNEALWPKMDNTVGIKYSSGPIKLVASGTVETVAGPNSWTQMSVFKPGEAYISWSPSQFLLNFGYQIFNWGVADQNNPSDGLNSHDWSQGWNAPKVPLLSADLQWFPNKNFGLEGVIAPYQSPNQFPVDFQASTQAALNSDAAQLASAGLGTIFSTYAPTTSSDSPANNPNSFVAAARFSYYSSAADLSISYVYDIDPYLTPQVSMSPYTVPPNALGAGSPATTFWVPGQIQLVNKRIHRFGANVKTTLGPYGLWLETGFDLTENPLGNSDQIRRNRLSWTAGTDFSWGPSDNFYVNLQYIGAWVPGYDQSTLSDYAGGMTPSLLSNEAAMERMTYRQLTQSLGDYTETLLQGLTWKLKFPLSSGTITPSLLGIVTVPFGYDTTLETRYASLAIKPELDLMPADSFHLRVGSDLAWAWVKKAGQSEITLDTTQDRLGVYTPDNDLYVSVEYQWNSL